MNINKNENAVFRINVKRDVNYIITIYNPTQSVFCTDVMVTLLSKHVFA